MNPGCLKCNTEMLAHRDIYSGQDMWYCTNCNLYFDAGDDTETTDPLGLGGCYKCGKTLCLALDAYHGKDDYAGHLCKECRYKYERRMGI